MTDNNARGTPNRPIKNKNKTAFYRSVFLSDFHMGAKNFDDTALLDFLKSFECKYLFLVGDIIDGWKLKKRWYWTENCNCIFDEILRKKAGGTKIIYLHGNHEDEVRRMLPITRQSFASKLGIKIKERAIHTTADGRKFLVLHGDQFDRKILRGPLSKWSDRIYDAFMDLINGYAQPQINIKGRLKPFSLAKYLSNHGKWALHLLNNFEYAAYREAKAHHVDGIICGHTHVPIIKNKREIIYANCGDWLRSGHTALVEQPCGRMELIDWPASFEHPTLFDPLYQQEPKTYKIVADSMRYRPITNMIVQKIYETWPEQKKSRLEIQKEKTTSTRLTIKTLAHFIPLVHKNA